MVVFKNTPASQAIHKDVIHRAVEYALVAQNTITRQPWIERNIQWERPNRGWHKLNTDGSSLSNPGKASGGGILCNESGTWIKAFTRKIGIATSFVAELWALRDGLNMCLNMQISALEIDLDAKVVADLMCNAETLKNDNATIVADCRHLLSQFPQVKVSHCYCEANRRADALARLGCSQGPDFMYLNSLPPCILNAFLSDLYGLSQLRLYPLSFVSSSF